MCIWRSSQRGHHSPAANTKALTRPLPGWAWDASADRWEEGFSRLLHNVERNGDARVPYSYTDDGYRLGLWVSNATSKPRQRHP